MDHVIHFLFWGLIEYVFFRAGRFLLWCISLGHIKLEKPTQWQKFFVASIGVIAILLVVVGLVS